MTPHWLVAIRGNLRPYRKPLTAIALLGPDAIVWYRAAAAKGNARAQEGLGLRYEFGVGVERDATVAYALYKLAEASSAPHSRLPNFIRLSQLARTGVEPEIIKLEQEMTKPGNLLGAIDYYIAHPPPVFIGD